MRWDYAQQRARTRRGQFLRMHIIIGRRVRTLVLLMLVLRTEDNLSMKDIF